MQAETSAGPRHAPTEGDRDGPPRRDHDVRDGRPAAAPGGARAVKLTKTYGTGGVAVRALDGVSVDIAPGRYTAVMGPSGSGKSTLMHCVAGLDAPTSGQVFIGDVELGGLSDRRLTRLRRERVGFVFQEFNLVPALTALENITLPMTFARTKVDPGWLDTVVSAVGLGDRLGHRPAELSGGQRQRVAVARALAARPEIIFADEPTGNLDSRSGGEVLAFLRAAVDELGQTVAMVTHDAAAAGHADEVVFLADGRVAGVMTQPTPRRVLDRMKDLGEPE